jgi:hypothetical protein
MGAGSECAIVTSDCYLSLLCARTERSRGLFADMENSRLMSCSQTNRIHGSADAVAMNQWHRAAVPRLHRDRFADAKTYPLVGVTLPLSQT